MKLPDFKLDSALNDLRVRMGMRPDQFGSFEMQVAPGRLTLGELEKLTTGDGIDVEWDELTPLPDGTLAYKDSRVLVYIRDVRPFRGVFTVPRYHFSNCSKLIEMRQKKRISRYVIATEISGHFRVNLIDNGGVRSEKQKLPVCQFCLDSKRFGGFSFAQSKHVRETFVSKFTPQQFFAVYPRSLPRSAEFEDADLAPLDDYPSDWRAKSGVARENAKWTCSRCRIELVGSNKKFLHVHHRNGKRSDSNAANLEVLCIGCHASEPMHSHIKDLPDYEKFRRVTGWRLGAR